MSSRTYERLNSRDQAVSVHFELGLRAYDDGDVALVKRHLAALALLPECGGASAQFSALQWRALWLQGEREQALDVARAAWLGSPGDVDACIEVADILVEMGAIDEAAEMLFSAATSARIEAELWYEAGLLFERLERWEQRLGCFEQVWEIEHAGEHERVMWLDEARFEDVAQDAMDNLPEHVRDALGNVVVFIEPYPERWIFDTEVADPRLLGLFDGVGRAAEAGHGAILMGPSRIYLFRRNIERICHSAEEVEAQIAITLRHEVGHYLGLDEDELHARGLG